MRVNPNAILIGPMVLHRSLVGMKAELQLRRLTLKNRAMVEKQRTSLSYMRESYLQAIRIRKLEKIIKQMELIELEAKINELKKAA